MWVYSVVVWFPKVEAWVIPDDLVTGQCELMSGIVSEPQLVEHALVLEEGRPVGLRNVFLSLRPNVPILPAGWPVTSASSTARMSSSKPRSKLPRRRHWRLPTLDLFDGRLILLVGKDGTGWSSAVTRARADVPLARARHRTRADGPDW